MTFQDDLDFAKRLVDLRDAFVNGEMDAYGYLKHIDYGDSDVYKYTLKNNYQPPMVFRVNKYGFDGVSSFQFSDEGYMLFHHHKPTTIWMPTLEDWRPASGFVCTEEFHFQQSLVHNEYTVREMLTIAYLIENPLPEQYEYFKLNMVYLFEMQQILIKLRDKLNAK